jgi:hypothetical protein
MAIVRLTTCDNTIEANFLKNNLENENIECFLTNELSSTLLPGYNNMLNGGIQVMIDEKDLEKASLLIAQTKDEGELKCPNCDSTNISFGFGNRKILKYLLVFFSLFAFIPFGNIRGKRYCKDCKTEF